MKIDVNRNIIPMLVGKLQLQALMVNYYIRSGYTNLFIIILYVYN